MNVDNYIEVIKRKVGRDIEISISDKGGRVFFCKTYFFVIPQNNYIIGFLTGLQNFAKFKVNPKFVNCGENSAFKKEFHNQNKVQCCCNCRNVRQPRNWKEMQKFVNRRIDTKMI